MSIFKNKIYFTQFIANLISHQMDFIENHFDTLIDMSDEGKVLTDNQKAEMFDKAHELMIIDIVIGCEQYFYKNISSEEVGEAISIIYGKYLTEHKKVSKELALKKLEKIIEFYEFLDKAEEKAKKHDEYTKKIGYSRPYRIEKESDKMKLHLCQAFCDYCVGEDIKSESWKCRHFAAFKFAMAFVKGDIVGHALKDYSVTF